MSALHNVRLHLRAVLCLALAYMLGAGEPFLWTAGVGLGHTLVMMLALTEVGG